METSGGSGRPPTSSEGVRQTLRRRPLLCFFSLAYAIRFIVLIPYTLAAWGVLAGNWSVAFILATFGPFVAGVVMVDVTEGRAGLSRLRHSITRWRVGWRWSLFAFGAVPALEMFGIAAIPGAFVGFQGLTAVLLVSYPVNYVLIWFAGGGLDEEVGWRGFALPRMQLRYGPLWGTLILGVVHCFWHLEEFLTPAQGGGPGTGWTPLFDLPAFLLFVLSVNIILTWVFNHTHGSLFAAISAHTSVDTPVNTLIPLLPAVGATSMLLGFTVGLGVPALLVVALTRGRLGYARGEPAP